MKMAKKLISLLLCLMLVVSMMSACKKNADTTDNSGNTNPTSAPSTTDTNPTATVAPTQAAEKIVLNLGIWPEDTQTTDIEMHQGFVKTFNASHPNVEVIGKNYHYAVDTIVSQAESHNLPTIFETWFTEPQKLIKAGYLADITDELVARGWDQKINPGIKDLLSKDGRIYGLPRDGYALGLMCNVAMFKAAGLVDADGIPIFPKTWQEVADDAVKIKAATGYAGFCLLAADLNGGWHFSNIAWAFGATLTTQDANGKYIANVNTPEAIAAMQFCMDLKWKYDVLTPDPLSEGWASGFAELGTGAAAMYMGAGDAVEQPTKNNGLPVGDLAMCAMPAGPNGDQYSLSGGTPYVFSADATPEQINAALDYLEVMGKAPIVTEDSIKGMETDAQNRAAQGVPVIPGFPCWSSQDIIDAQNKVATDFGNVDMRLYDSYFNAIKTPGNLHAEEQGSAQDLYGEITKVLQAVLTDENADVAALMKTANDNYQTLLDNGVNK